MDEQYRIREEIFPTHSRFYPETKSEYTDRRFNPTSDDGWVSIAMLCCGHDKYYYTNIEDAQKCITQFKERGDSKGKYNKIYIVE